MFNHQKNFRQCKNLEKINQGNLDIFLA